MQKKKKKNKKQKTNIILLSIFISLLILVIILGIVLLTKKNPKVKESDLAISLSTTSLSGSFSIKLDNLKKDNIKNYSFKVRNYYKDKLNKVRINYIINFTKPESVVLTLYKNEAKTNLLSTDLTVKRNTLRYDQKQDDYYELEIKAVDEIAENSKVDIKIIGEKAK